MGVKPVASPASKPSGQALCKRTCMRAAKESPIFRGEVIRSFLGEGTCQITCNRERCLFELGCWSREHFFRIRFSSKAGSGPDACGTGGGHRKLHTRCHGPAQDRNECRAACVRWRGPPKRIEQAHRPTCHLSHVNRGLRSARFRRVTFVGTHKVDPDAQARNRAAHVPPRTSTVMLDDQRMALRSARGPVFQRAGPLWAKTLRI